MKLNRINAARLLAFLTGRRGVVPAPEAADSSKFLRGDATWAAPSVSTIVGISGTKAEFNSACSDGDFAFGGGTCTGTNTGDQTSVTGNAGTVTVADAGGDTTCWVLLGTSQTGNLSPATDAGLTYNATTDTLTATTFVGALTGNASTAATLQTARNINGVSFDGSAAITIPDLQTIVFLGTSTGQASWSSQPSGDTAAFGTSSIRRRVQSTRNTQARVCVGWGATGNSGAKIYAKYSTNNGSSWTRAETGAGTSGDVTFSASTESTGAWFTLDSSAIGADILFAIFGSGGNGSTALTMFHVEVQFK